MVDHGIPWSSDHQFRLGVEKVVKTFLLLFYKITIVDTYKTM